MQRISWLAMMALTGAGLLFWRIGGAIGAEIAFHEMRFENPDVSLFILGLFGLGLLLPGTMAWSAVIVFKRLDQRNARRLAIAAAVALYFVLPALLHTAGMRPSGAPTLGWAVAAFFGYRYLLRPTAMKAASASFHSHA